MLERCRGMGGRVMWSRERGSKLQLVDVADAGVLLDVDTREAYERALGGGC